jgi:hypothetical protein
MLLVGSRRCGGKLFRALFAEVDVDEQGAYLDHRLAQPGFVCLNCGSPAVDLAEVPGEIAAEQAADLPPEPREVLCPVCETLVEVGPEAECPVCGSYLETEA